MPVDPRAMDYLQRLSHISCLDEGAEGPCAVCGQPITRRQSRVATAIGLSHTACSDEAHHRYGPGAKPTGRRTRGSCPPRSA